ncbi:MAG: ABC transporter ATP-binding protein [Deltaproteobacteria bacterium]|nr:ABC transporter ATP-binding protein [Deltaproteobacteria bacterium]
MALIELKEVTKIYTNEKETTFALSCVNMRIHKGEFLSVLGPSGSGKSTLLTTIGGLNRPSSGKVILEGISVYDLSQDSLADLRRKFIGFVFQSFQLVPYLTVLENVMLPLSVEKIPKKDKRDRARELLTRVGLERKEKRLPDELSGGEQQRVAIARALVNRPSVLLADEPTGNLDRNTAQRIIELFLSLNADGLTIIMATHNTELASLTQKRILLSDGQVVNLMRGPVLESGC